MRTFRGMLAVGVVLISLLAASPTAAAPAYFDTCEDVLGFKMLQRTIPGIVGDCVAPPYIDPSNGTIVQQTTHGTLLRRTDNAWPYFWVAFTDGQTTYLNGPNGLQMRPNDQSFAWESNPVPQPVDLPTVAPDQGYIGPWDPYFPIRSCADFHSQAEAQGFFRAAGDWPIGDARFIDRHNLDPEHDGWACGSPPGFAPPSAVPVPPVRVVTASPYNVYISGIGTTTTFKFPLAGSYTVDWTAKVGPNGKHDCTMTLASTTGTTTVVITDLTGFEEDEVSGSISVSDLPDERYQMQVDRCGAWTVSFTFAP